MLGLEYSTAFDATAGGGGNSFSLLKSGMFGKVVSCELNPSRAKFLEHNIRILFENDLDHQRSQVIEGDGIEALFSRVEHSLIDFLFLDPPWGGLNYRDATKSLLDGATVRVETDYQLNDSLTLSKLLAEEIPYGRGRNRVKVIGVKVPDIFDPAELFSRITAPGPSNVAKDLEGSMVTDKEHSSTAAAIDERPHPFRIQIGARTVYLLVAYPPYFQNADLDNAIYALRQFDLARGEVYHPRYFDWEKQRFISIKRWKGYSGIAKDVTSAETK